MVNYIAIVFSVIFVSACSTTDKFEKRAGNEWGLQAENVTRAVDKSPKWMDKLPESKDAVYANGSAISRDFSMADEKAKLIAFGQLCTSAGGEIDKQSLMFLSDTETSSSERSELTIRSMCRGVDISGAETVEIKRIAEGSRYRSYVLVVLPLGEANTIGIRNDRRKSVDATKRRSEQALKELDENARR
jgi:hypothetical protein